MFQNQSGILSDRQIRELCVSPTFVVSEQYAVDHVSRELGSPLMQVREVFSWKTEEELEKAVWMFRDARNSAYQGIVAYRELRQEERESFRPMIEPFSPKQVKTRKVFSVQDSNCGRDVYNEEKIVSYGLSSAGYDVRLGRKFKIFTNIRSALIDPLNMSDDCYVDHEGDDVIIPPHSYILGHTPEVFDVPRDVMIVCVGKSTYARAGCAVNVTPIEPGFKGQVVIEIANQTPLPMKVYADMGIAQFLFFKMSEPCETSYADRAGKYQNQTGITTARV